MPKYDTRKIDTVPFSSFHDSTLKNARIHSLCSLPLCLATHILECEQQLRMLLERLNTCFMKCMPHYVGAHSQGWITPTTSNTIRHHL